MEMIKSTWTQPFRGGKQRARFSAGTRSLFDCFLSSFLYLSVTALRLNLATSHLSRLNRCSVNVGVLESEENKKPAHKVLLTQNSLFFFLASPDAAIYPPSSLARSLVSTQWRKRISLCKVWQVRFNKWTTMLTQHVHKLHHKPRTPFVGSLIV